MGRFEGEMREILQNTDQYCMGVCGVPEVVTQESCATPAVTLTLYIIQHR